MEISRFASATPRSVPSASEYPERRGSSGFPSPADDYLEAPLSLDRYLVLHPASTFYMRVSGDNLSAAGFHDGDLLIVDRALTPHVNDWVVATIDGVLTLQRLESQGGRYWLHSGDNRRARIPLDNDSDHRIWGLVCHGIHAFRGKG